MLFSDVQSQKFWKTQLDVGMRFTQVKMMRKVPLRRMYKQKICMETFLNATLRIAVQEKKWKLVRSVL